MTLSPSLQSEIREKAEDATENCGEYSHALQKWFIKGATEFAERLEQSQERLRIATEALEKVHKPDVGGVQGMIIADMGFTHFAQHTAKTALSAIGEIK